MDEDNAKIIEMIKNGKSANEMASILGISNKQLYIKLNRLKCYGINLDRFYHDNGNITYGVKSVFNNEDKDIFIVGNPMQSTNRIYRIIAVSDEHRESKYSDNRYMEIVYDYAKKNGINIIFNSGDVFEGFMPSSIYKVNYSDPIDMIDSTIKKYPFDKNIINFMIGGNHDMSFYEKFNIDIGEMINSRRHDMVFTGYGLSKVVLSKINIFMRHDLGKTYKNNTKLDIESACGIVLSGHEHRFKIREHANSLYIKVPTLSDIMINNEMCPCFLDITINTGNNTISLVNVKELWLNNDHKVISLGESSIMTHIVCSPENKFKRYVQFKEEESSVCEEITQEVIEEEIIEEVGDSRSLSMIDKFSKRYGIK